MRDVSVNHEIALFLLSLGIESTGKLGVQIYNFDIGYLEIFSKRIANRRSKIGGTDPFADGAGFYRRETDTNGARLLGADRLAVSLRNGCISHILRDERIIL